MDKMTNEEVLSSKNEKRSLIKNDMGQKEELYWTCCKRRWSDEIGARRENGRKEPRGRPRMGMIDDVLDETYGDMKRKAETERIGEFRSQGPALWQRTNDDDDIFVRSFIWLVFLKKIMYDTLTLFTIF